MTKEERLKAAEAYAAKYTNPREQAFAKTDLIAGAEAEAESKWISVEELPKAGSYLVWNPNLTSENKTERATYANYNNQWMNDCHDIIHPSHWQPLPSSPLNQQ